MNNEVALQVLEGVEMVGDMNTPPTQILANMRHAIRQGHPQVRAEAMKPDRVALVASGPSLNDTLPELRELVFEGAKVVTVNGAYHWCIERNIRPSAQIVLDAQPSTARFLSPEVPQCLYMVASQCHPDAWAAVAGRPRVAIWHSMAEDNPEAALLDDYYDKHWHGVVGGTTVATRGLMMLRAIGYLRFDLFGVDCCWLNGEHHALPQAENEGERRLTFRMAPTAGGTEERVFECAPWHVKSFEDWLQIIRVNGHLFALNVHGGGMLAYALRDGARVVEGRGSEG